MKRALVAGVFDLFHIGHVRIFKRAREAADYLVVAVNGDEITSRYKRRPIISEDQRLEVVKACRYVDTAFMAYSLDVKQYIADFGINVVVHGNEWDRDSYLVHMGLSESFLASRGIELRFFEYTAKISTSGIIKACAGDLAATRHMAG